MNIFVSRPTWISSEFEEGLDAFLLTLKNMGLIPRTLGASDYPSKAPLDEVIEIMDECKGAIVLGYPQISVISGTVKDEPLNSPLILPTEWNHIEAALAYSKGLPLMILHHLEVSRGVFDRGVMNAFVHQVNLTKQNWCLDSTLNGAMTKWKENCISGNANFGLKTTGKRDQPICPNCSTNSKPIYLSKLSVPFNEFGDWICSRCDYSE